MRLETDGAFHFDFYLGEKLHKSIDEVRAMSMAEWQGWVIYFSKKNQQRELANARGR